MVATLSINRRSGASLLKGRCVRDAWRDQPHRLPVTDGSLLVGKSLQELKLRTNILPIERGLRFSRAVVCPSAVNRALAPCAYRSRAAWPALRYARTMATLSSKQQLHIKGGPPPCYPVVNSQQASA